MEGRLRGVSAPAVRQVPGRASGPSWLLPLPPPDPLQLALPSPPVQITLCPADQACVAHQHGQFIVPHDTYEGWREKLQS